MLVNANEDGSATASARGNVDFAGKAFSMANRPTRVQSLVLNSARAL